MIKPYMIKIILSVYMYFYKEIICLTFVSPIDALLSSLPIFCLLENIEKYVRFVPLNQTFTKKNFIL